MENEEGGIESVAELQAGKSWNVARTRLGETLQSDEGTP